MDEMERVIDAFRNCITEPKCRDCPWKECEEMLNPKVEIPITLALEVNRLLMDSDWKINGLLAIIRGLSFRAQKAEKTLYDLREEKNAKDADAVCSQKGRKVSG
jgi:hypothetical protein